MRLLALRFLFRSSHHESRQTAQSIVEVTLVCSFHRARNSAVGTYPSRMLFVRARSFLNPRYVVRASAPVSGWRRRSARCGIPASRLVAHRDDRAALPALRAAVYMIVLIWHKWVRSRQQFVCRSLPSASEFVALNFAAHISILHAGS